MGFRHVMEPKEEKEHHSVIKVDTEPQLGTVPRENSKTDKAEEIEILVREKDHYEEQSN